MQNIMYRGVDKIMENWTASHDGTMVILPTDSDEIIITSVDTHWAPTPTTRGWMVVGGGVGPGAADPSSPVPPEPPLDSLPPRSAAAAALVYNCSPRGRCL